MNVRNLPSHAESVDLLEQVFHRWVVEFCCRCSDDNALKIDFLPLKVASRFYYQIYISFETRPPWGLPGKPILNIAIRFLSAGTGSSPRPPRSKRTFTTSYVSFKMTGKSRVISSLRIEHPAGNSSATGHWSRDMSNPSIVSAWSSAVSAIQILTVYTSMILLRGWGLDWRTLCLSQYPRSSSLCPLGSGFGDANWSRKSASRGNVARLA